ncbi:hypothetical protein GCM10023075_52350 [Streptosporangium album]
MSSRYVWGVTLDDDTSAKITSYRPRNDPPGWQQVAEQVQATVAAAAPMTGYRVERLLHVVGSLALWCQARGLPADPELWLRHESIDTFVLRDVPTCPRAPRRPTAPGCARYAPRSRGLSAARRHRPHSAPPPSGPPPTPHPNWPDCETGPTISPARSAPMRWRCWPWPPDAAEAASVRGSHLRILPEGAVVLDVPGTHRLIVARARWEAHLAQAAESALADSDRYLFRPRRSTTYAKNLVASWAWARRPAGALPALSARRLRASWIVELLTARIDPGVVAAAAGLAPAALARYQHFVPPLDEPAATALLRGGR